jgi:peptidoglycan hydrolase-like protein with peptidoglycan-binding domain
MSTTLIRNQNVELVTTQELTEASSPSISQTDARENMQQEVAQMYTPDRLPIDRTSSYDDIRQLQSMLRFKGFLEHEQIDGQFGQQTVDAVRKFQESVGLEPDGVVGQQTWRALGGGIPEFAPSLRHVPRTRV